MKTSTAPVRAVKLKGRYVTVRGKRVKVGGHVLTWGYTKRDPRAVQAERRAANKRARASRKANRG